jgi:hypothetical protein
MFELVKRNGRREEYDCAKLARSLTRAGVVPYMLAEVLDRVVSNPDRDTGTLRARVESVLALRQPTAARRYASTRSLTALGSEQAGYGWVCMNSETVSRLSLRPGDTIWLSHEGAAAPFSIESLSDVERGHAWLNTREMAAMGVRAGTRLAASSIYQVQSSSPEESPEFDRVCVTGPGTGQNGGW